MLGELDIGQSVIVENGVILGVEGAEGTDALIKRCALYRKSGKKSGILVKCLKPTQDPRLDTPVIGINTLQELYNAGMNGIAISEVIIINPEEVLEEANRLGIFIVVMD